MIHALFLFQVFYTGKSQALGIKQGGPSAGKWAELPITKSPKIVHLSVGHEGQHALLVAEDGSVFFVGLDRRGEGGDPNQCESGLMLKLFIYFNRSSRIDYLTM